MVYRSRLIALLQCVGVAVIGAVTLQYAVEHSNPGGCETVVHVTEPGVDVWIDDHAYRVESWQDSPLVCELRPGRHTLRMSRYGRILHEEAFTLRPGADIVLTAWDEARWKAQLRTYEAVAEIVRPSDSSTLSDSPDVIGERGLSGSVVGANAPSDSPKGGRFLPNRGRWDCGLLKRLRADSLCMPESE